MRPPEGLLKPNEKVSRPTLHRETLLYVTPTFSWTLKGPSRSDFIHLKSTIKFPRFLYITFSYHQINPQPLRRSPRALPSLMDASLGCHLLETPHFPPSVFVLLRPSPPRPRRRCRLRRPEKSTFAPPRSSARGFSQSINHLSYSSTRGWQIPNLFSTAENPSVFGSMMRFSRWSRGHLADDFFCSRQPFFRHCMMELEPPLFSNAGIFNYVDALPIVHRPSHEPPSFTPPPHFHRKYKGKSVFAQKKFPINYAPRLSFAHIDFCFDKEI